MTIREVAAMCDVSVRTVRSWIEKGKIRGVKKNGKKEYEISEFEVLKIEAARNVRRKSNANKG